MKLIPLVVSVLLPVISAMRFDRSASEPAQRREEPVDPVYEMFRNFMGQFPNYGQPPPNFLPGPYPGAPYGPGSFIPYMPGNGGFPPFVPQPGGGGGAAGGGGSYGSGVSYGSYGNTAYPILNGMGYSGPFYGAQSGVPNPNYGNLGGGGGGGSSSGGTAFGSGSGGFGTPGGNVPIVNTRVNTGPGGYQSGDPGASTVTKSKDGSQVSVAVRNSPDGRPVYRSETVRGPGDSYGTAFAYST